MVDLLLSTDARLVLNNWAKAAHHFDIEDELK
jgi:hypothetical protein